MNAKGQLYDCHTLQGRVHPAMHDNKGLSLVKNAFNSFLDSTLTAVHDGVLEVILPVDFQDMQFLLRARTHELVISLCKVLCYSTTSTRPRLPFPLIVLALPPLRPDRNQSSIKPAISTSTTS